MTAEVLIKCAGRGLLVVNVAAVGIFTEVIIEVLVVVAL